MLGASVAGTIGRVGWGGGRWLVLGGVRGEGMCGGLGVGLNSWREELCLLYSKLLMRHYQEDQSELTVQCLLHGVDAVVLHLGRRLGL